MSDTTLPEVQAAGASATDVEELTHIADALVQQVGEARRQLEELRGVLEGANVPALSELAAAAEQAEAQEADPGAETPEERLQLDALNMALIGSTREDARGQLLELFSQAPIEDVEAALDSAYGDGDGEGGRRRRFARLRR